MVDKPCQVKNESSAIKIILII